MRQWVVRGIGIAALLAMALVGTGDALAGGGCHVKTQVTDADGSSVTLKDCGFAPVVLRAPVGAKISWSNDDHVPHGIHGLGWGLSDPMGVLKLSEKFEHTFGSAGIYPYMCYVHPGMSGVVIVGDAAATVPVAPAAPAVAVVAVSAPSTSALTAEAGNSDGSSAPLAGALIIGGALAGYGLASLRRARSSRPA